jgi:biotin carboxyl carrier protein
MASTPEGRRGIARVADQVLPALIARLSTTELGELEVREGDWRVRLRRDPASPLKVTRRTSTGGERAAGTARVTGGERSAGSERGSGSDLGATSASAPSRLAVRSPAVGYFTPSPALAVAEPVRAGDVLGHVDVLGVPVDVVAQADGRIGRLYAVAGEAVEYGQELVRLDGVEASAAGMAPATDGDGRVGTGVDRSGVVDLDSTEAATDVGLETEPVALVE